jgi:manganese efflux pump family protein
MDFWELIVVAVALGTDAFSVAIVGGCLIDRVKFRPLFRLSFHFGLFQFLMPVIGWFGGTFLSDFAGGAARYIASGLLALVAIKMFIGAIGHKPEDTECKDISRGLSLISLSVATSIDALLVGLGIGLIESTIWFEASVIGIVAAAMTVIGYFIGRKVSSLVGERAEILGAIALGIIAASYLLK